MEHLKGKRVRVKKGFDGAGQEFTVDFVKKTMSLINERWNPSGYFVYSKNSENIIDFIRFAHEVEEVS